MRQYVNFLLGSIILSSCFLSPALGSEDRENKVMTPTVSAFVKNGETVPEDFNIESYSIPQTVALIESDHLDVMTSHSCVLSFQQGQPLVSVLPITFRTPAFPFQDFYRLSIREQIPFLKNRFVIEKLKLELFIKGIQSIVERIEQLTIAINNGRRGEIYIGEIEKKILNREIEFLKEEITFAGKKMQKKWLSLVIEFLPYVQEFSDIQRSRKNFFASQEDYFYKS